MQALERKRVRLGRAGGSSTIVLPKAWLRDLGVDDEVDIVRTASGILVEPSQGAAPSIEDEPEFPRFLAFLQRASLVHPGTLVNVADLTTGDDDLFADVVLDDD